MMTKRIKLTTRETMTYEVNIARITRYSLRVMYGKACGG